MSTEPEKELIEVLSGDQGIFKNTLRLSREQVAGEPWNLAEPEAAANQRQSEAAAIPARAAHVTHALMEAWTTCDGSGPLTAAEICEYENPVEAPTVKHTASALREAKALGLVDGVPGLWFATGRAWELRRELEARAFAEQGEGL